MSESILLVYREIFENLSSCLRHGHDFVLAHITGVTGSAPRNEGAKILVTDDSVFGSIGGGRLEFEVIQEARALLLSGKSTTKTMEYSLGASLGQCCGGRVQLFLEAVVSKKMDLFLFGAGHVGKEIVKLLSDLPLQIHWVDSRENYPQEFTLPSNVKLIHDTRPESEIENASDGSIFVILTHSHDQDFDILLKVLRERKSPYIGLIGSRTKWERFQKKLEQRGVDRQEIEKVHCPIGATRVKNKHPRLIAVSIIAQLLPFLEDSGDN